MSIHWRIAPRITSTVKRKTIILLSILAASAFIAALAISWEFLTPKVNRSANPISTRSFDYQSGRQSGS